MQRYSWTTTGSGNDVLFWQVNRATNFLSLTHTHTCFCVFACAVVFVALYSHALPLNLAWRRLSGVRDPLIGQVQYTSSKRSCETGAERNARTPGLFWDLLLPGHALLEGAGRPTLLEVSSPTTFIIPQLANQESSQVVTSTRRDTHPDDLVCRSGGNCNFCIYGLF